MFKIWVHQSDDSNSVLKPPYRLATQRRCCRGYGAHSRTIQRVGEAGIIQLSSQVLWSAAGMSGRAFGPQLWS